MLENGLNPLSAAQSVVEKVQHNLVLAVIVLGVVYYDWNTLGPTLAIQHGATAAAISWLLVVPLAPLLHALEGTILLLGFIFLAFAVVIVALITLGPLGCLVAPVALLLIWLVVGSASGLAGYWGSTLVFLAVYLIVRQCMAQRTLDPAQWPGVELVDPKSAEFRERCQFFSEACDQWAHKYDFGLQVARLYRVSSVPSGPSAPAAKDLFHGTPWEAAKGIVCDGFRMPNNPGMFGKGLYFADCPLKSWRYCFKSFNLSKLLPKTTGRGGLIFMCSVDLGTTREERAADHSLSGYRRGWRAWFSGYKGAYDSVTGVEMERGGALRVPEYVVYSTTQVRLAYLFEVFQKTQAPAQ